MEEKFEFYIVPYGCEPSSTEELFKAEIGHGVIALNKSPARGERYRDLVEEQSVGVCELFDIWKSTAGGNKGRTFLIFRPI